MAKIVGGEGPENAEVMLIGQNPGREEARQSRPFVGRSGKYLDTILKKNHVDRDKERLLERHRLTSASSDSVATYPTYFPSSPRYKTP